VKLLLVFSKVPATVQALFEAQETLVSKPLVVPGGSGALSIVHCAPFQISASGWLGPWRWL
jgi:hypothetical protein